MIALKLNFRQISPGSFLFLPLRGLVSILCHWSFCFLNRVISSFDIHSHSSLISSPIF